MGALSKKQHPML